MLSVIHLFKRTKYGYNNKLYSAKNDLETLISQSESHVKCTNVNFDRANALMTQLTVNGNFNDDGYYFDYNYLYDETRGQRWFITGVSSPRGGQYVYTLVRDVFVDYKAIVLNAPMIVTKANQITSDVKQAQYDKTFNLSQVKTGETLLKDDRDNGWVYVYLAKNAQCTENFSVNKSDNAYNKTITLTHDQIATIQSKTLLNMTEMRVCWYEVSKVLFKKVCPLTYVEATSTTVQRTTSSIYQMIPVVDTDVPYFVGTVTDEWIKAGMAANYDVYKQWMVANTQWYVLNDDPTLAAIVGMDGQVVIDQDGNKYTVGVKQGGYHYVTLPDEYSKTMLQPESTNGYYIRVGTQQLEIKPYGYSYDVTLTKIEDGDTQTAYHVNKSAINNRMITSNCLYDIMAFPVDADVKAGDVTIHTSYADTINFVQTLKKAMGDSVYDIQWLPYGPDIPYVDNVYVLDGSQDTSEKVDVFVSEDYVAMTTDSVDNVTTTTTLNGAVFSKTDSGVEQIQAYIVKNEGGSTMQVAWVNLRTNSFSRTIEKELIGANSDNYMTNRINNETTMYRLCSPNWSSQFEFSAVRNNGLSGYTVSCTLKPINPYVRVQPIFSGLYGTNYNDPRGLVFKGDFSVEQTTSVYQSYQLANRNYQLAFDREIQSLDLRNSVADKQDALNTGMDVLGIFTGGITGAAQGTTIGAQTGIVSSGIGAAIGAGVSVAGGIADLVINNQIRDMNKSLRMDAKDASIKQFQYRVGNLMAQPNTLSRSTSFDALYRIFPVLETYECTPDEKNQLMTSIQYNGVPINQVSTLQTQIDAGSSELYVAGVFLRTTGISDQVYGALSQLLADGIYIERS